MNNKSITIKDSILEHTTEDEKKHQTKYYNLDAILSISYRANSSQATTILRE